jgi:hypothetical protein
MTVKELIRELKRWPSDMRVAAANHDNDADEISAEIEVVQPLEDGTMRDAIGPRIVLRP